MYQMKVFSMYLRFMILLFLTTMIAAQGEEDDDDNSTTDSWGAVVGLVVTVVVLAIVIVCLLVVLCESRRAQEPDLPKLTEPEPIEMVSVTVQTDSHVSDPPLLVEEPLLPPSLTPIVANEEIISSTSEATLEVEEPGVAFDKVLDNSYVLSSSIVYGESASIVKATQNSTSREVAIKVFNNAELCLHEYGFYDSHFDPDNSEAYNSTKSFIPELLDAGQITLSDRMYPAIVIEKGHFTLKDFISPKKKTPQYVVFAEKSILYQICVCLRFLHQDGYVHGDLNPESIMFFGSRWKLIDFAGIGKVGEEMQCRPTPGSAAPEVICEMSSGAESIKAAPELDIWSLGSIAYEIITKQPILPDTNFTSSDIEQMCFGKASFPWEERPYAFWSRIKSPAAVKIVQHCLQRDPAQRWTIEKVIQYIKFWS